MPMECSHHPYPGEHRWPVMFRNQHSAPYKVFFPKKTQKMVYSKGKLVYELVDPDGNVYVLQAHEEKFPIDSLVKLGEQLKLPKGLAIPHPDPYQGFGYGPQAGSETRGVASVSGCSDNICRQISSPQSTRSHGVLEIAAAPLQFLSVATAVA
jgi:hypothetical protein